jgi:hypothetical protein
MWAKRVYHPQMTQLTADKGDLESFAIIGAAITVHRSLRYGFLKSVYQEAMVIEFALQRIPHVQEPA